MSKIDDTIKSVLTANFSPLNVKVDFADKIIDANWFGVAVVIHDDLLAVVHLAESNKAFQVDFMNSDGDVYPESAESITGAVELIKELYF